VEGEVAKKKLGVFHYDKRLRSGRTQHVRVSVYSLRVDAERDVWPEVTEREKLWTSREDASDRVQEIELSAILSCFEPS